MDEVIADLDAHLRTAIVRQWVGEAADWLMRIGARRVVVELAGQHAVAVDLQEEAPGGAPVEPQMVGGRIREDQAADR